MANIVSILISQHNDLQRDVEDIIRLFESAEEGVFIKIDKGLKKFIGDLTEHLKLENETFYVELLAQMKKAEQDTSKTESFIAEMKDIEVAVNDFLEKFKDVEKIENDFNNFKDGFIKLKEILILRIESEEAGVYSYWGLF